MTEFILYTMFLLTLLTLHILTHSALRKITRHILIRRTLPIVSIKACKTIEFSQRQISKLSWNNFKSFRGSQFQKFSWYPLWIIIPTIFKRKIAEVLGKAPWFAFIFENFPPSVQIFFETGIAYDKIKIDSFQISEAPVLWVVWVLRVAPIRPFPVTYFYEILPFVEFHVKIGTIWCWKKLEVKRSKWHDITGWENRATSKYSWKCTQRVDYLYLNRDGKW